VRHLVQGHGKTVIELGPQEEDVAGSPLLAHALDGGDGAHEVSEHAYRHTAPVRT
jgi:hypothetical protein